MYINDIELHIDVVIVNLRNFSQFDLMQTFYRRKIINSIQGEKCFRVKSAFETKPANDTNYAEFPHYHKHTFWQLTHFIQNAKLVNW